MSPLHALTLGDVLREHRRSWPEQTATVDHGFRMTYAELDTSTNRLANALSAEGVRAGDRILWLGQNSFRLVETMLAAAKLGAFFCPANWRQSADEMAFVLADLEPAVVVWQDAEIGDTVRAAREQVPGGRWIRHDSDEYDTLLASGSAVDPDIDVDPADPVLLMYTAAFSGRPNAAMLSHTALIGQALMIGRLAEIDSSYVYLNCGPLFHIATFFSTLARVGDAGPQRLTPRRRPEEFFRQNQNPT
jgi:long-chain acyl-CoA synthetase